MALQLPYSLSMCSWQSVWLCFDFQHCKRPTCFVLSSPCRGWPALRGQVLLGEGKGVHNMFKTLETTLLAVRRPQYERTGSQHRLRAQKPRVNSFTILTEHQLCSRHHFTYWGKHGTENEVPAITELTF